MKRQKINPAEIMVGMRVSYCVGKYRKVITGDITDLRRVATKVSDTNNKQTYSTNLRARVGMHWVNASQLFREVDTTLILE